ncbi:hypothetical protein B5S32_g5713 [[Candida] boidinii]|nr:hypothetical protein B5S29_g5389 [[Candida] boidinii]OWB81306.1 hypothetical protein B5S32_g5713 [[Candida] boidinii]GME95650.1 unnamed protein product [[Candida] boidinii]
MICNISGQPTLNPVVSPKSRKIFDKSLIIEYININGKDPITNESLNINELIELNNNNTDTDTVNSRPLNTTSIPSLLSIFQNEFNSIILENFELKKNLNNLKKELSISLYKYDSSINVISKLIIERDELKKTLQDMAIGLSNDNNDDVDEIDTQMGESISTGNDDDDDIIELSQDYVDQLNEAQKILFQKHKNEKIKFDVKSINIKSDKFIESEKSGDFSNNNNKIKLFDSNNDYIVKLTINNNIIIENKKTGELNEFKNQDEDEGEGEEIIKLKLINQDLIYINSNNSIKLIKDINNTSNNNIIEIFNSNIKIYDILIHPLLFNLIILINENGSFSLIDINEENKSNLIYKSMISETMTVSGCDIHGDGLLLSIGDLNNNSVHIFDITTGKEAINFNINENENENENGNNSLLKNQYNLEISKNFKIKSLKFSTNGYSIFISYFNEISNEDIIIVFDLRKNLISSAFKLNELINYWQIDKSSNILITLTENKNLVLHKYVKNGKKWISNCNTIEIETSDDDDKVIGLEVDNLNGLINTTVYLNNGSLQSFKITN